MSFHWMSRVSVISSALVAFTLLSALLKLTVRKKPYPAQIAPKIHLMYRRNKGAGVWSVKAPWGLKRFALADDHETSNNETIMDYWQALKRASELARVGEGNGDSPIIVDEALTDYEADLKARGADKRNVTTLLHNLPDRLRTKAVALLNKKELNTWRNGLVDKGLTPASADRVGLAGLESAPYGTHSMRRTKAAQIYRKTSNLRAVQLLLGHTKLESTVRYLGIEVDDALNMAEQIEL